MKRILSLFVLLALSNCQQKPAETAQTEAVKDTVIAPPPIAADAGIVGNDSDEHGCKGSAGYIWSVVRNECVRLFEVGVRLDPKDATLNKTMSAFVILATDASQAELFLPNSKSSILKRTKDSGMIWSDGKLKLSQSMATYTLEDGHKVLYQGH